MILAMMLPIFPLSFAMAADGDVRVVWEDGDIDEVITAEDRETMQTVGPFDYVDTNTAGSYRLTTGVEGISIIEFLDYAGVDTDNLEQNRVITFSADDGFTASFTWRQLTEERFVYTYPGGTGGQVQLRTGVRGASVPAILSFNVSGPPRNYMGLTYPHEQLRGVIIQNITTIRIGGLAQAWGAPYVFIENGEFASGTPLPNGSTVEAGTKLRLDNEIHGQSSTSHKYHYTVDGTDPVPGNASTYTFNWNSQSPSTAANPSIVVPPNDGTGKFTIKAITHGYGRPTSNVMTFTYNVPFEENSAFLTGPDEVNIDTTDEIEYTLNVANVTDINLIEFELSYDVNKLVFQDIDTNLPPSIAAWVIPPEHDEINGIIKVAIAGGARGATFTSEDAAAIANLKFSLKGGLAENDTIETELLSLSVVNPITGNEHDASITTATVTTTVTVDGEDPWLKYDINQDGVYDLVDLAIIIYRYYMVASGESLWSEASTYDHMNINVIDTRNIIALYSLIGT